MVAERKRGDQRSVHQEVTGLVARNSVLPLSMFPELFGVPGLREGRQLRVARAGALLHDETGLVHGAIVRSHCHLSNP